MGTTQVRRPVMSMVILPSIREALRYLAEPERFDVVLVDYDLGFRCTDEGAREPL